MALKVVRSAQMFTETALDEIRLLKCVSVGNGWRLLYGRGRRRLRNVRRLSPGFISL